MVNVQYLTRISLFFEGLAVLSQIVKSGAADLEFYLKNSCNSAPLYQEPCKFIDENLFLPHHPTPFPPKSNTISVTIKFQN